MDFNTHLTIDIAVIYPCLEGNLEKKQTVES